MGGKRVLVCGGRDAWAPDVYYGLNMLRKQHDFTAVITGGARGADEAAHYWAGRNGISAERYPADWKRDGRKAGPLRNARMLTEGKPDLVIAFSGGRGTADMVKRAKAAGVEVIEVPAALASRPSE